MINQNDNYKDNGRREKWFRICASILPFLVFYAVYEIVLTILQLLWQSLLAGAADNSRMEALLLNAPWASAMMTAISMTAALLCILRAAVGEIKSFDSKRGKAARETGGWNAAVCFVFFFAALCLDLGLNTLFSVTGFSSLAGTAALEQGGVSLTWGVAVYGVLTPLIEEIVFRGALFARIVRLMDPDLKGRRTGSRKTLFAAAVGSSLLFGLWHGNLPQGILGFAVGMVLSSLYAFCGVFALPVFLHGLLNIFMLVLSYTGVYNNLCTPTWCAGLLFAAAGGMIWLYFNLIRDR